MGAFDWGAFGQSAGNSFLSNVFSWFGAKQQHKRNKELMSLQNDYTLGQMAKSNEYWQQQNATQVQNQMDLTQSNPILQKIGMQQAGMNVNGQMSGNIAAAPSGTNAPSGNGVGNPGASNPFVGFDLLRAMKEMQIMDAQRSNIEANTKKTLTEEINIGKEGEWIDKLHQAEIDLKDASIDELHAQIYKILMLTPSEQEQIDAQTDAIINGSWRDQKDVEQYLAANGLKTRELDLRDLELKQRKAEFRETCRVNNSIIFKNYADGKLSLEACKVQQASVTQLQANTLKLLDDRKVTQETVKKIQKEITNLSISGDIMAFERDVQNAIGVKEYARLKKEGLLYDIDLKAWSVANEKEGAQNKNLTNKGELGGRFNPVEKPKAGK